MLLQHARILDWQVVTLIDHGLARAHAPLQGEQAFVMAIIPIVTSVVMIVEVVVVTVESAPTLRGVARSRRLATKITATGLHHGTTMKML